MNRFGDLNHRDLQQEIMDRPDLEERRHLQALAGLARINRWSGSCRILWPAIRNLAREGGEASLRVLDVATGAGDVPVGLWRRARAEGIDLIIEGCDISPRAIEFARRYCAAVGARVRFFVRDVLDGSLPETYDVVICSLFLHHLSQERALQLLSEMARAARRMVLVNDLRRSSPGLVFAVLGTRLLTRSHVVHIDGPRSVRGAFRTQEVREIARAAGLGDCNVAPCWPFRFLLTWRKA